MIGKFSYIIRPNSYACTTKIIVSNNSVVEVKNIYCVILWLSKKVTTGWELTRSTLVAETARTTLCVREGREEDKGGEGGGEAGGQSQVHQLDFEFKDEREDCRSISLGWSRRTWLLSSSS